MRALTTIVVLIALVANTSGCATIIHGRSQDISLASTPPGATVKVGGVQVTTPGSVTLRRDKDYSVVVEKEGYPPQQTKIESTPSWWLLGNIALGGIIGLIIDLAAGGAWSLSPDTVDVTFDQRAQPAVTSAPTSAEHVPGAAVPVAAPLGPTPPPALALERQLDQLDELKAKGRITEDEHGALRRRAIETAPLGPVAASVTASSSPAVQTSAQPPLAGRWRGEGSGRGRLEIADTTIGQLSWEYEATDAGTLYRMSGTGHLAGDRLELTGTYTAGDGYSLNKSYALSLRRDGPLLVGTSISGTNKVRPLRFSKEP